VHRSIRDQILIPLVLIQVVAVCAIALTTAEVAARRSGRQIIERLDGVLGVLGRSNFPYTPGTLAQMRGLSGAEFVAYSADGRPLATSLPAAVGTPPGLPTLPEASRLDGLGREPAVRMGGVRYFAVLLDGPGPPGVEALLVLYPETSWRQARREAATPPLLLGGAALAMMVAASGWVARRISRRLGRLERRVARIAAGDFEALDPGPGRDEVSALIRSVNAMCLRLAEMSREIRQAERARLLAQLAAGLAHQLRNSITGARMSIQLHARRSPPRPGDRTLEVALMQLAMTEEQVKGLLSLGRVEARPASACDLGRIVREVALLVGPAGEHSGVSLEIDTDGSCETPPVMAEESGLRAAALNLALNAIEAAGRGGAVRLRAVAGPGWAAVEVVDTGPGPPPELAGALFEPFVTGKAEGVGLGLALARHVAQRHGGTLRWDRQGGETRFLLSFPPIGPGATDDDKEERHA
jgi:signal transduction histidine kinase